MMFSQPVESELENKACLKAERCSESGSSFAEATSYLDGTRSPGQLDSEISAIQVHGTLKTSRGRICERLRIARTFQIQFCSGADSL